MLEQIFIGLLNMSFTASIVILFVLFARMLLKKSPKVFSYALWSVVLFRLLCPFSFESVTSFLPINTAPIPHDIMYSKTPQIDTGVSTINNAINPILPTPVLGDSVNPLQVWIYVGAMIWILGIAVLLIYSVVSLYKLKKQLRHSVFESGNIYITPNLSSPFVLGFFRPKIYLPENLAYDEKQYILRHEQTHINRCDHGLRIISFLALCLHWFNPLVWVAFFVSGNDMEMSCDESVIKASGNSIKKSYSSSLLALSTNGHIISGSPLAFSEGDTKGRIKNVLGYKKPTFGVIIVAVIAVLAVGIGLVVNPKESLPDINTIYSAKLTEKQKIEATTRYELASDSNIFESKFRVSDNIKSYVYYVELYQHGKSLGTFVQNCGNFNTKDSTIVTAFSPNTSPTGNSEGMRWTASFADGGYATHLNLSVPSGFVPQGLPDIALLTEANIAPDKPIIVASIAINSAEGSKAETLSPTYLMEHPEKIEQYECVYLVRCIFSEKDESELMRLASGYFAPTSAFERYNDKGEITSDTYYGVSAKDILNKYTNALAASDIAEIRRLTPAVNLPTQDIIDDWKHVKISGITPLREDIRENKAEFEFSVTVKSTPEGVGLATGTETHYLYAERCDNGWYVESSSVGSRSQSDLDAWWSSPNLIGGSTSPLPQKTAAMVGINATVLEKDEKYAILLVAGTDNNSPIGDKCMVSCVDVPMVQVIDGATTELSFEDISVGDSITLDADGVKESYPTQVTPLRIQLVTDVEPKVITYTKLPDFAYSGTDPVLALVYDTELTQYAEHFYYDEKAFLVPAVFLHGSYEEGDKLKVFVTIYDSTYRLFGDSLKDVGGAVIPVAITYTKGKDGVYTLSEYLPSRDGSEWATSIKEYCTYPVSGKTIPGLAEQIISNYSNSDVLSELQTSNLIKHLNTHKQTGISLVSDYNKTTTKLN